MLRGFFCNMNLIDISTTKLKEKINKTIKPRLKKVGGEVKEVEVGKVTRDDVLNLIKIKKAKNKEEKQKAVSDFLDTLEPNAMTEEGKAKLLDDLDSY